MAQIIKEITLDVSKNNLFQAIVAKQHDTESRFLKATICDDGTKINISSTSIAVINAERADGESKAFSGTVNDDGTITVPLTGWMLELDDTIRCSVSIIEEGRKLTTTSFTISVESAEIDDSTISEDENHDLLVTLIGECSTAKAECETAAAAAADAHKMKLIRKITTTKDVISVTINQDTNDLAFSLDKFVLLITAPSDLVPNNGTFNVYVPDASASSNRIYTPGNVIYNTKKIVVRSEIIGDGETAVFDTWASCSIFGSAPSGTTQHGDFVTGKPITSVTATYTSNTGFPAGTEIKLYGHRG